MPTLTTESPATTGGPDLERAITLTDAVVAIAMTLLVLPLVEISGEVDTAHLGSFLSEHGDLFLGFAVSFLVIYVFWAAHGAALDRLRRAHVQTVPLALRQLNMWWLLVIAFLPFPTAVVGRDLSTTSAPFYIGTMLVLSTLTSAIVVVVGRVVARAASGTEPGTSARPAPRARLAWSTTAVFAVCTLVSTVNAELGVFGLLVLAVMRVVEVRLGVPRAVGAAGTVQAR